jgi:hypothetical protein
VNETGVSAAIVACSSRETKWGTLLISVAEGIFLLLAPARVGNGLGSGCSHRLPDAPERRIPHISIPAVRCRWTGYTFETPGRV